MVQDTGLEPVTRYCSTNWANPALISWQCYLPAGGN